MNGKRETFKKITLITVLKIRLFINLTCLRMKYRERHCGTLLPPVVQEVNYKHLTIITQMTN